MSLTSSQGCLSGPRLPALPLEDLSVVTTPVGATSTLAGNSSSPPLVQGGHLPSVPIASTRQPNPISDGHCPCNSVRGLCCSLCSPHRPRYSLSSHAPHSTPHPAIPTVWAVSSDKPGSHCRASQSAVSSACSAPHPASSLHLYPLTLQTSV